LARRGLVFAAVAGLLVGGLAASGSASAAAAAPTLVGHWALDESSGSTAADSSGNGHTGTVGAGAGWTGGQVGAHALALNGTATSNVDIPEPVVDTSQSFTVSAWVRLTNLLSDPQLSSVGGVSVRLGYCGGVEFLRGL
jgi:hypothetical protein